jgi:hypothetical protein
MAKLGTFNSQELANTLWALAKLDRRPGATLQRLLDDAVCWQVDEFKPQELANTLWAMAKLGHGDDAVLGVLERAVRRAAERLNANELTQVLWAHAKLGRAPAHLAALTDCAQRELPYMTAQGLAIALWAFAKLGCTLPPELLQRFAEAVRREAAKMDPSPLVITLWAFATMGIRDVGVMGRLDNAVVVRAEAFNAQDVANSIWAYARLSGAGYRTSDLVLEQLGVALERNIDSMTPQHVSNALWG